MRSPGHPFKTCPFSGIAPSDAGDDGRAAYLERTMGAKIPRERDIFDPDRHPT